MSILWKRTRTALRLCLLSPQFQSCGLVTIFVMSKCWSEGGSPFNICILKRLTGSDCPGCGLTRSFIALTNGNLIQSMHLHPLGPLFYMFFGMLLFDRLMRCATGQPAIKWINTQGCHWALGAALLIAWIPRVVFLSRH